jgi:hypothetical protein
MGGIMFHPDPAKGYGHEMYQWIPVNKLIEILQTLPPDTVIAVNENTRQLDVLTLATNPDTAFDKHFGYIELLGEEYREFGT